MTEPTTRGGRGAGTNAASTWALDALARRSLLVGGVVAFVLGAMYLGGVRYNSTPSLPEGLYTEAALGGAGAGGEALKGQLVMLCLPAESGRFGLERGYLNRGGCPGGASSLGKAVVGVAGDTVTVTEAGVTVGGTVVPYSEPVFEDTQGRDTNPRLGVHVIGPAEVFVMSNYHGRSFDSRYFGPIPESSIRGKISPLATWGHDWEGDLRLLFAPRQGG